MNSEYSLEKFLEQKLGIEATDEVYESERVNNIVRELRRMSDLYREISIARTVHLPMAEKREDALHWIKVCEDKIKAILKSLSETFHLQLTDDAEKLPAIIFELDRLNFLDAEIDLVYTSAEDIEKISPADAAWVDECVLKKEAIHKYLKEKFQVNLE